ncbi:MAG TPA: 4-hydroxyphenylacetate 3-hydroxylase N-terminal domain-containing protein [Acidimicrobiales bacterium]|nr:4-hydroxyphenylacetate 3-hydroxylase N-terminal domain-containing protein [Acidimicrobiales bacterium]
MTRTGAEYLESLRDGRHVVIDGERVDDVTTHPAFRRSVQSFARLYDLTHERPDVMTFPSPTTGRPVNRTYLIPRTQADLESRRQAMRFWAQSHYGFLGRTPDHLASLLTAFAATPDVLAKGGPDFARNAIRMYERCRDDDLYMSYVIINPQIDKSRSASQQEEDFLFAGVVAEHDDGFVVRGAKMIGTSAIFSNLVFVSSIQPMQADDIDYALSFAIPIGTPGLRFYSRRSYEASATSVYDYPLSSRFDENDCLVVFDDVKVPWENTFVYRNVDLTAAQFFQTPAHVYINTQAQIRCWTKLEFIAGLAHRVADTNGVTKQPIVADSLGRLASLVALVEAGVRATEAACEPVENATDTVVRPNAKLMYATMANAGPIYLQAIEILRTICGGGVIQVPSSVDDFFGPGAADIRRYVRSPGTPAEERVKLFKLAWDVIGSEFGSRHAQYEIFYSGGPQVARAYAYRNFDWGTGLEQVERCLASTPLERGTISRPSTGDGR